MADGRGRYWARRLLLPLAAAVLALAMAAGSVVLFALGRLNANIRTDHGTEALLGRSHSGAAAAVTGATENILLMGTDSRAGANAQYGHGLADGPARSDTTILLHLPADRSWATAVSIPRDLMVQVPACPRAGGGSYAPRFVQFNWAFELGGASCTIRTVEQLMGLRVDHFATVDFTGFKKMVDAVGGVEVCLPKAVHDRDAKLDLPAGRQLLNGSQALGYVRVRHALGDGSDISRMGRQQAFLAALVQKVDSDGVLLDPTRLYPLLDAATSSLTTDSGLNSLDKLYRLASGLRALPRDRMVFLTVPQAPWAADPNRVALQEPAARQLFTAVRNNRPVAVEPPARPSPLPSARPSAPPSPVVAAPSQPPSPEPLFTGRAANADIC
ncbi:hypothetical protein BIV57_05075 [Mangrovactinospora gilvigrisea]|uniref:Cell envelope-related transcriptional attenuator domain-containing protein n=1 Tax=Mangrovactinospora gilvigrisea TaxID=1428644 RepID=A0A1J7CAS8_9ACTN|nr:LCP family protein [Mangrovactinospora gilvigrisea]OIV38624.1 hypothetical protein BIV57_05075 [Mangrovactinospora gilvigrisea]